jgi:hypothetical protein
MSQTAFAEMDDGLNIFLTDKFGGGCQPYFFTLTMPSGGKNLLNKFQN